jgi:hypothetical protein
LERLVGEGDSAGGSSEEESIVDVWKDGSGNERRGRKCVCVKDGGDERQILTKVEVKVE